jgi:putative PIN family toxin of toxin-antitoxin system
VRVVLDTNILISACWTPGGLEARMVNMVLTGALTACVSPAVWAEYREVLLRDKFAAFRQQASELLTALETRVRHVDPMAPVSAASDEDDNRFLECASAGAAEYLITGNLKHYPPHWGPTKIVNARQFLLLEFAQTVEVSRKRL